MAEQKRWSGNQTSRISLYDREIDQLVDFAAAHEIIYIFGDGKIGKALGHYMREAQIRYAGHITSNDLERFQKGYVTGRSGIVMGVSDRYFPEIMPRLGFMDRTDICSLSAEKREEIGRIFSIDIVKEHFWINIFTTNQCNLNCKSCSSFAPVCPPDLYGSEQFKNDIDRLCQLDLEQIAVLKFTGGEPFLHPQLFSLFGHARKRFPDTPIECYTNGLVLRNAKEEILQKLKELEIMLVITEYPLKNMDMKSLYERLDRASVAYCVIYSEGQKFFSKRPLDFSKKTKPYLFAQCPRYKACDSLFLFKGRLYKCIYALASGYFNKAFGTELKLTDSDWLDLYETTPEKIYRYCISRLPYCGYCSPIEELVPWGLSEKSITEWT